MVNTIPISVIHSSHQIHSHTMFTLHSQYQKRSDYILFADTIHYSALREKMIDESVNISGRTWTRTVENISKVGYSDGVCDGQNKSFQNSFDMGYCQGLEFGLDLGYKLAIEQQSKAPSVKRPADPRSINCNICLDPTTISQNVVNLYNTQKEKNDQYLKKTNN